jgi:hypothetical protein
LRSSFIFSFAHARSAWVFFRSNVPSEIQSRPNPFYSQSDPHRVTKESFRVYIDSITRAQFDIVVSASDTIAQTLGIASGWRRKPIGSFRAKAPVQILPDSAHIISHYGQLSRGLMTENTDFLSISESRIVIRTRFYSRDLKVGIEVFDVFVFTKDANGWIFDGYDLTYTDFPCIRPKVWKGQPAPCQSFQR